MELNITDFFNACRMSARDYSASVAELGNNAGQITWNHAKEDSAEWMLLDDEEKKEAFRAFVQASGDWSEEEIAAWNDIELNALLLQWIAGDIREDGLDAEEIDWEHYQEECELGRCSGRIFGGPMSVDGQVYFHIGC